MKQVSPSHRCIAQIMNWEDLRLEAYQCPSKKWTIGYGHTGFDVHSGLVITVQKALQWFSMDINKAESPIHFFIHNPQVHLTQGQVDALTSFIFNAGQSAFTKSPILTLINQDKLSQVPEHLLKWDHDAEGQELWGLKLRRELEAEWWNNG